MVRQEPLQDLINRLATRAWAIFWRKLRKEARRISFDDAASQALQNTDHELALPPDVCERVSVHSVVNRMKETASASRERKRNIKEAEKLQRPFGFHKLAETCAKVRGQTKQGVLF